MERASCTPFKFDELIASHDSVQLLLHYFQESNAYSIGFLNLEIRISSVAFKSPVKQFRAIPADN
jgi:hypothetical protein